MLNWSAWPINLHTRCAAWVLKPGDRVMLVLPNIPQFIVAFYGTLKIGGVVVLPNPEADATHIVQQANHTEADVLVTLRDFGNLARQIVAQTALKTVIVADIQDVLSGRAYHRLMARWHIEPPDVDDASLSQLLSMQDIMQAADTTPPDVDVSAEALAAIIFTSGTTDAPKGVCLTHANLVANTMQTRHWVHNMKYGQEVSLAVVPLMHSYGMTTAMNIPIALGSTIVLLPVFEIEQVLDQINGINLPCFPACRPCTRPSIKHPMCAPTN